MGTGQLKNIDKLPFTVFSMKTTAQNEKDERK